MNSLPELSRGVANRDPRVWKLGFVVLAVTILATSLIGIYFSLPQGQSEPGRISDTRAVPATPRKFTFTPHASPRPIANVEFEDDKGQGHTLADFRGKVVLVNVWATWCSPCRAEMPTLDRLQSRLGGTDFAVVALSIDRGGQAAVKSFYDEIDVHALPVYVDASAQANGKLGVLGVPTTLLLDRTGREIGRVTGPAEWDSAEVIDTIRRYLPLRRQ